MESNITRYWIHNPHNNTRNLAYISSNSISDKCNHYHAFRASAIRHHSRPNSRNHMSKKTTQYIFHPDEKYRGLKIQSIITSNWYIISTLILMTIATTLWIFLLFSTEEVITFDMVTVVTSITGIAILISIYGATYYKYRKPPQTTTELLKNQNGQVNTALAAEYEVVRLLGRYGEKKDQQAFYDAVMDIFAHEDVKDMMARMRLDPDLTSKQIYTNVVPIMTFGDLMRDVVKQTAERGREHIAIVDIAGAFLLHEKMQKFLRKFSLREKDIAFVIWWQHNTRDRREDEKRWWDKENMLKFTGVGLSWAAGYTPVVDQFSHIPRGNLWDIPYGHKDRVDQLINSLARQTQSNVLVVGQPGVGRLGVVKEMADRVNTHRAHPALDGKRVVYIHVGELMSLGSSGPEQLNFISQALNEMEKAGNIIAVLDGVSSMLARPGENQLNLTDVLLPFFSSPTVRVVVVMSSDEYHLRIKTNEELLHLFEIIQIPGLSPEKTTELLAITANQWERAGVYAPYQTIREIVENTTSILPYLPFPEKAFDVLEEVIVATQTSGKYVITPEDINEMISAKVGIDVGKLREGEKEHLLNIEDVIHRRVINQKRGVASVSKAMIRARAGVRNQKKPIGTFLFLGPTGVGKTETAKALAEAYFGSEDYMQRLDMSEFQSPDSVAQLVGDSRNPIGRLTSMVADRPFSVLLLDEFEKAARQIQQIFLPVFDEGYITDARGRKYSFTHTIMIATSNAGAEFIRTSVREDGTLPDDFEKQLREHILREGIFRPEVLNRFDDVTTFTTLSQEHIRQIAQLMLRKLNKRLDLKHGVTVVITEELLDFLTKVGYNPEFGARPMARAIADTVEYAIAEQIIRGTAEPGQEIVLSPDRLEELNT